MNERLWMYQVLLFKFRRHLCKGSMSGGPKGFSGFKITTTATATRTSLNKSFNEQNNGSARAL